MKKEKPNKDNNSPFKQFNFKFNFYWIYGIIFALLIGYQLLNSSDLASNKLTQNEFNDILNENDLAYYYDLENTPGTTPSRIEGKFDFLDNAQIVAKLLEFNEQKTQIVTLLIPSIHCSSCIWVLENLHKIHKGVEDIVR